MKESLLRDHPQSPRRRQSCEVGRETLGEFDAIRGCLNGAVIGLTFFAIVVIGPSEWM